MTALCEPISILAVDDHPVLREGIIALIATEPDLKLVGEASNGHEAVEQFKVLRPHVTLMDIQMPDMTGIEAILAIRAEFPGAKVIVLTTYRGDALAQRAIAAGACSYILKSHVGKDLVDTIRAVHCGDRRIEPAVAATLADHSEDSPLTPRELEILTLVAGGNANRHIASQLAIYEETVKGHLKNIFAKLHAKDRTHAVMIALRRGILQL